jgi:hypothetical protein
METETATVAELDFTFQASWYGEDEYLQDCKVTRGNNVFEGDSVPDMDLSTKGFHISEDGNEATHLFHLWSGVEDGEVFVTGEFYDNPFCAEDDLKSASLGSGWDNSEPGEDGLQELSERIDGILLFMLMQNSDYGMSEYDLDYFRSTLYRWGDNVASFERGYA